MAIFSSKKEKESAGEIGKQSPASAVAVLAADVSGALIQPRVSEKAGRSARLSKYIFVISHEANKISVRKAVEKTYKVRVTRVNIIKVRGKKKNFGRIAGQTSGFKKAVVTLKQGDSIKGLTETV